MFDSLKAITVRTLVVAIGGTALIAGPTAAVEIDRPVPFTASFGPGPEIRETLCEVVDGTKVCRGLGHSWFISDVSEPMLDGEMVVGNNRDEYPGNRWFMTWTYRIENADGAWEGSAHTSTLMSSRGGPHSVVLEGEGGYAGLYAWMDMTDWDDINGVIFPAPPPEAPIAPVDTREQ